MTETVDQRIGLLERKLAREQKRRTLAERALEDKARELHQFNEQLVATNDKLKAETTQLSFLLEMHQLLREGHTVKHVLSLFLERVSALAKWPIGHLYTFGPGQKLVSHDTWYLYHKSDECAALQKTIDGLVDQILSGVIGIVLSTKQPIWIENITTDDRFIRRDALKDFKVTSYLAVPIKVKETIVAVAEFFTPTQQTSNEHLVSIIKAAARQVATMIEQNVMTQQLKKNYADLQAAQTQLVQSEKMASLGTIAAGVAHEINNPIGYVLSNFKTLFEYVESLLTLANAYEALEPLVSPDAPALQTIHTLKAQEDIAFIKEDAKTLQKETIEGVQRIQEIVQGLKTFAHAEEATPKEVDVNEVIQTTLKVVWNELKYHCTLEESYAPLPLITGFSTQLGQVFMNLMVNAGHAMKEKGTLRLKTWHDQEFIFASVEDTGSGMAPETLKNIFTPFFTTKAVGEGTGLGLSISYGIIEKHGGTILVESTLNKGTCFTLKIPLQTPLAQQQQDPSHHA